MARTDGSPRGALGVSLIGLAAILPGCGGSAGGGSAGGGFVLLRTEPSHNGTLFLNQSVRFCFSNPVDLTTANFNTIAFQPSDRNGPIAEQVVGKFRHGTDELGATDRRILEFVPRLPSNDSYSNGGFKPARSYLISVTGGTNRVAPALRDASGRVLSDDSPIRSIRLTTVSGRDPRTLFLDTVPGGPRVLSVDVGPDVGGRIVLNHLGAVPVEVRLRFDQPLNPHSRNMPIGQSLDPRDFARRAKGRIFIAYDDPELGKDHWVPADLDMPENDATGATVLLRPDGVLPNAALLRVVVTAELQDIAGGSNSESAEYEPVVATFRTLDAFASQFDAVVLDFETDALLEPEGRFRDPVAALRGGMLEATFDFEGDGRPFDFDPVSKTLVLNTDVTQVPIRNGPPLVVTGGVFHFRSMEIDRGILVSGTGTNPMVFLVSGGVRIDGALVANGGDGSQQSSFRQAHIPQSGGIGVCTGGQGGRASQNTTFTTPKGEAGFGPRNRPGGGGEGGLLACGRSGSYHGSGGGGGSHAVSGDPGYTPPAPHMSGAGGNGSSASGVIPGGTPGRTLFADGDGDNDFWGRGFDAQGNPVKGELRAPIGGGGGGGGGDKTLGGTDPCVGNPFINDFKGGGGGGGAGVIVIKALGSIVIGPSGRIAADGGRGGGGQNQAQSSHAGGGGAGAGGMVVLMSATGIDIHQHGGRWVGERDIDFALTADGSVSWAPARRTKYETGTGRPNIGGFGGMGIVQLMTPPGRDLDGTGTVQDDNIRVLDANGKAIVGAGKTRTLFGGDIRPDPWLLPAPFSRFSQAQTRWIATGATVRRSVPAAEKGPRSLLQPARPGPEFSFSGVQTSGKSVGYLVTHRTTGQYEAPVVTFARGTKLPVTGARARAGAEPGGLLVHEIDLEVALLPADGSLESHRARALSATGTAIGEWRILRHTASQLRVDARDGVLPAEIASIEILAKFFEVVTDGVEGLGRTYEVRVGRETLRFPAANVQIAFAFHKDPADPRITGEIDAHRWPRKLDTFLHDLQTPAARSALRDLHYPFVKMQVRFNLNYDHLDPSVNPGPHPASPDSQRPGLRFLFLPYRY